MSIQEQHITAHGLMILWTFNENRKCSLRFACGTGVVDVDHIKSLDSLTQPIEFIGRIDAILRWRRQVFIEREPFRNVFPVGLTEARNFFFIGNSITKVEITRIIHVIACVCLVWFRSTHKNRWICKSVF